MIPPNCWALCFLFAISAAGASPIISELHFHPFHEPKKPEPAEQEWLEILNPDTAAVDLSGWRFTSGVSFQFPAEATLAPGARLVIAADRKAFLGAHSDFTGTLLAGWNGKLSNGGEKLRLEDKEGRLIEELTYADDGDWATHGRGIPSFGVSGWEWLNPADGQGYSLERASARLPGGAGQNWASSNKLGGTPGEKNTAEQEDAPPLVFEVEHSPKIPHSKESIRVSARVVDDHGKPLDVSLLWSVNEQEWKSAPMVDPDGDGEFQGLIPAQVDKSVVEFEVRASDGSEVRVWPPPGILTNPGEVSVEKGRAVPAVFQVDDSVNLSVPWIPGAQPNYRLILSRREVDALGRLQTSSVLSTASVGGTMIVRDGTGVRLRYRCHIRNRGATSRLGPPNNYHVSWPGERPLDGRTSWQFNARFTPSQVLGAAVFARAGLVTQDAAPAKLWVNGRNAPSSLTYGTYARVEPLNSTWLERHFPEDSKGNLYRVDDHTQVGQGQFMKFGVLGAGQAEQIYLKETNLELNDYTDLKELADALNSAGPFDMAAVSTRINLEQWLTFMAMDRLLGNQEGGLGTGRTDDFSMYRGIKDQRFTLIPHDLDSLLGIGEASGFLSDIFVYARIRGLTQLFNQPEVRRAYLSKYHELTERVFNNQVLDPLIEEVLGGWADREIPKAKAYIGKTRERVLQLINRQNEIRNTSQGVSPDGLAMADASLALSGLYDVTKVLSITVNGQPAQLDLGLNATGNWRSQVALSPGINSVTTLFHDGLGGAGNVVFSETKLFQMPDATPTAIEANGQLAGKNPLEGDSNIIWPKSKSPFVVRDNITIPAGQNLLIEPGVNIWVARAKRITVKGNIQILGSPTQRVVFSNIPNERATGDTDPFAPGLQNGPLKWGGLRISDSMERENLVRHTDFLHAQGLSSLAGENLGSLGALRSWLTVDNCSFQGSHLRLLYARNSKISVSNCVFADQFGPDEDPVAFKLDNVAEPLKIEYPLDAEVQNARFDDGFPIGGWCRVYQNHFHGNKGHNDVFDADGGRWGKQFVLDCRYNYFHGVTGDEHIDLGGDAFIFGNIFERGSKDQFTSDTGYSNAISSGDRGTLTTIMAARNVFFDLDHAINLKAKTATIFEHNTCANFHEDYFYQAGPPYNIKQAVKCAAVNVFVPEDPGATAGDGVYMGYNILSKIPRLISNADRGPLSSVLTTKIELHSNLLHEIASLELGAKHPGGALDKAHGSGNILADPGFHDPSNRDFRLGSGSVAKVSAPGGVDYGASIAEGIYFLETPPPASSGSSARFVVGGPGIVAYRWRLDGGAWSESILIGEGGAYPRNTPTIRHAAIEIPNLKTGKHSAEFIGQDFAGIWQTEAQSTKHVWSIDSNHGGLLISEISAEFDTIELFNTSSAAVSLVEWNLSEDIREAGMHPLPSDISIPPGAYITIDLSRTGLRLDRSGDKVFLFKGQTLADEVAFGAQAAGFTIGRLSPSWGWKLCTPTPSSANQLAPMGTANSLRISEWLAAPSYRYREDWIELANSSAFPVALEGLRLSDHLPDDASNSALAPLSFIAPNGFVTFVADGDRAAGPEHLAFSLDDQQDRILLMGADGQIIDQVSFLGQTDDHSQSYAAAKPTWHRLPTPGGSNIVAAEVGQRMERLLSDLKISEIMYHAAAGEDYDFLELQNTGTTSLDLEGVSLSGAVDFPFPKYSLEPGSFVLVVANEKVARASLGIQAPIAGEFNGKLDNAGEQIFLRLPRPFSANIAVVRFSETWYPETDGAGRSLELVDAKVDPRELSKRQSWLPSAKPGGTPAGLSPSVPELEFLAWKTANSVANDDEDKDRDGLPASLEYALGLSPKAMDPSPLELVKEGGWRLRFSLPRNEKAKQSHGLQGVTYIIEQSPDLQNWSSFAAKSPESDWNAEVQLGNLASERISVQLALSSAVSHYLRLRVRLAGP